jgi:hypothetical protein
MPHPPGVIESDQFCTCGYNLHGQVVTIDERLEMPVIRCPECGRWHPAGHGSSATRPWLRRLAAVLLLVWVLILCLSGLATAGTTLGLMIGWFEEHTTNAYIHPTDGRLIEERVLRTDKRAGPAPPRMFDFNGQEVLAPESVRRIVYTRTDEPVVDVPAGTTIWRFANRGAVGRWKFDPQDSQYQALPHWGFTATFIVGFLITGLVLGTLQSAMLWHLRGPAETLPLTLVVGSVLLMLGLVIGFNVSYFAHALDALVLGVLVVLAPLLIGWLLALRFGRPVARQVIRLLVPPGPRQALAHLWHADGKSPGAAA